MRIDLERARKNPRSVFDVPETLRDDPDLSLSQKRDLLRSWLYDARRLDDAVAEGMGGGESALTRRIADSLAHVQARLTA